MILKVANTSRAGRTEGKGCPRWGLTGLQHTAPNLLDTVLTSMAVLGFQTLVDSETSYDPEVEAKNTQGSYRPPVSPGKNGSHSVPPTGVSLSSH